ncbi:DNA polymerase IV [bacterium]|nr:DNA polymerase IV [bacterium]
MSEPTPLIFHVDMDSFYVSVERLKDPSLIGKPVIVGGTPGGRGVVASASYEARAFGVHSAMPCSQAIKLCPKAIFVRGHYHEYGDYSRRIREVMEEFTPIVRMASQDEAYLDMTGTERLWGAPMKSAHRIRQRILEETQLPCSLGLGSTRTIAKIASALCKPRGILWVPAGSEREFLSPLPIAKMPGIGPKSEKRLNETGLKYLGDVIRLGRDEMERLFGAHGAEFHDRACGIGGSFLGEPEDVKSVSHEVTFERDTADREFLAGVLSELTEKVASRLRKAGARAATVSIKYRYTGFETHTAAITIPSPTADERVLLETAVKLLEDNADPSRPLRLIGIAGCNLIWGESQMDFFSDSEETERRTRLLEAIDSLREKHGFSAIRRAKSRDESRGQWG